ncbi:phytanoyl-CoA dioxygenase family protein [Mesorhizobium tianshanense]|nr:phytanoyl-CoA dioxygenase family protein [Mesorhizobium tianshanense]
MIQKFEESELAMSTVSHDVVDANDTRCFVNPVDIPLEKSERFKENGFIKIEGLLSPACIQALREAALLHVRSASDFDTNYGSEFKRLTYGLGQTGVLRRIYTANSFRKIVVSLIGNPLIMSEGLALELRKGETGFTWHYDSVSFRFIRPIDPGYSIWIPLNNIDPDRDGGGMAYIPENLLSGVFNYQLSSLLSKKISKGDDISAMSSSLQKVFSTSSLLKEIFEENKVEDEFSLGDVLLFTKSVWHRTSPLKQSGPNSRLAVAIRLLDWRSRLDSGMFEGETHSGGGMGMGVNWGNPKQTIYGSQFVDIADGDELRNSRFCGPII